MAVVNSTDFPIDANSTSGSDLATRLNRQFSAVISSHSNATRPTYLTAGGLWAQPQSPSGYKLFFYDGTTDHLIGQVDAYGNGQFFNPVLAAEFSLLTAYSTGDLIYSKSSGNYLEAKNANGPGAYNAGDWQTAANPLNNKLNKAGGTMTGALTVPSITVNGSGSMTGTLAMGSPFTMRNRLINGNMYIAQRATSATVTAGTAVPTASTGYPCVDRWYVYSTGANVTAAQVAGSGANRNVLRITGAASVTAVGIGQRIESVNSYDLAGSACTLSVDLANSLLTTVTWTAYYANTTDTFGTVGTATRTQIATGTFTVTSTLTRYTASINVPSAATTGIEIVFTVGAQTSGTFSISNVQFEKGGATPFEVRNYQQEYSMCQRYYNTGPLQSGVRYASSLGSWNAHDIYYKTTMRATPTIALSGVTYSGCSAAAASANSTDKFSITVTTSAATPFSVSGGTYEASAEI